TTGDPEGAGRAKLSIIEELSGQTPAPQLVSIYQSAVELLKQSQDPSTSKRLIACAQKVIEGLRTREFQGYEGKDLSWASFKREIRKAEKALLARSLQEAEGSVTKAAHLLGFKHHQSLISIINIRHKELLKTRSTRVDLIAPECKAAGVWFAIKKVSIILRHECLRIVDRNG